MSYYKAGVPGLHVPLMTLIDYMGFRLIAMSILPLEKMVYGSNGMCGALGKLCYCGACC